jgi:hypothetical protein
MPEVRKPFSTSLYDANDTAKDTFIKWLQSQHIEAWVNPDQYGIDVLSRNKLGIEHAWEVEVKHNWKGSVFPFDSLHYSSRKKKFLEKPKSVSFVTFNSERTHMLISRGVDLAAAEVVVKDTIYTKGEKFIEIPVDKCRMFSVELGEE